MDTQSSVTIQFARKKGGKLMYRNLFMTVERVALGVMITGGLIYTSSLIARAFVYVISE